MANLRRPLVRIATKCLEAADAAGAYNILGRRFAGRGVIFSLHRIVEPASTVLAPGHMVTSVQLDRLLEIVIGSGWDLISIDELPGRLSAPECRRFACFTCDDGYLDNLQTGLKVFQKHKAPFTVYLVNDILARQSFDWCPANHELILRSTALSLDGLPGCPAQTFPAGTFEEKLCAYRMLDAACHRHGDAIYPVLKKLYGKASVNLAEVADQTYMNVEQARALSRDPLVTIGAHTITHRRLSLLGEEEMRREVEHGRAVLESALDISVRHFAYPFGRQDACGPREFDAAARAGYTTAVTTRQGNIFEAHASHLNALPRRSVPLTGSQARRILFGVETLVRRSDRVQIN